ncbi:helix-turn-helix domain-containing protein [Acholeplasma sp. OttesenSCG-928-E16]|nr:helix-turn-helix domain-containing protein [Acholeplasma sp. OttesenSCG-928-E16]
MFDMKKIGKKIATLRKEGNMTQLELADKLGISYQAVSNWERGDSMPDISKLEELSEIFGISIDELLDNKRIAKIAKEINENKNVDDSDMTKEELVDAATLQKPSVIKEFVHNYQKQDEEDRSLSDESLIKSIAPFLDEDILEEMIDSKIEKKNITMEFLFSMSPFLSEDYLGDLIEGAKIPFESLSALAPFLSEKKLGEKAIAIINEGESPSKISGIAPFLSDKHLKEVVEGILNNGGSISEIVSLAPFLDEETLGLIVDANQYEIDDVLAIIPFLNDKKVAELAKKAIENNDFTGLQKIMPFIDNDELRKLMKK